jgi:hypothetical protein
VRLQRLCHSASDLPLAYAKALEVMEYKTTLDLDDVVFYRDITNIDEKGLAYPPGFEARLVNAVKIGDAPRAFETIRDAVSLNRERRCPPELMRYLMVNIAGTVIRAVSEMDEKPPGGCRSSRSRPSCAAAASRKCTPKSSALCRGCATWCRSACRRKAPSPARRSTKNAWPM